MVTGAHVFTINQHLAKQFCYRIFIRIHKTLLRRLKEEVISAVHHLMCPLLTFVFISLAPLPGVSTVTDEECQEHFDNFFEDVFVELEDKYGEIEEMNVCDNLGDHLVGNVYVKVSCQTITSLKTNQCISSFEKKRMRIRQYAI